MPVTSDAVGKKLPSMDHSWTDRDVMLYALGVGAGPDELCYTYENAELRVLPTFAVVPAFSAISGMGSVMTFNPMMVLHGEQRIELHRPIPTAGMVTTESEVVHVWDKGKGAVVVLEARSVDSKGEPLFTNTFTTFLRGEGGFGGDRGPSGPKYEAPDRPPDREVDLPTRPDQALLYRLNGDRNPLHADPGFASMAGFPKPILHGLCTYGFTGRGLLHLLCDSDPARFHSMEARFTSPVMPGESLTVEAWRTGEGTAAFRTTATDGRVVLDGGVCTYSST